MYPSQQTHQLEGTQLALSTPPRADHALCQSKTVQKREKRATKLTDQAMGRNCWHLHARQVEGPKRYDKKKIFHSTLFVYSRPNASGKSEWTAVLKWPFLLLS
jgi:hypothetical protein